MISLVFSSAHSPGAWVGCIPKNKGAWRHEEQYKEREIQKCKQSPAELKFMQAGPTYRGVLAVSIPSASEQRLLGHVTMQSRGIVVEWLLNITSAILNTVIFCYMNTDSPQKVIYVSEECAVEIFGVPDLFYPEDGCARFLRNVCTFLSTYTAHVSETAICTSLV